MIITRLYGGLGNQMFQYALAKSLAWEQETVFKLDLNSYRNYKLRGYSLADFNINAEIATEKEINQIIGNRNNLITRIYMKIYELSKPYYLRSIYQEQSAKYDPNIRRINQSVYLNGYWQSPKYFHNIRDQIRRDFTLKRKQLTVFKRWLKIIKESPSVAVHIRRDDYITDVQTSQTYYKCSEDYYQKGLKYILNKIGSFQTFIFSDDITWIKKNSKIFHNMHFVSGKMTDVEELILISKCNHQIIANSTFSWWGAWLNNNKNKIVIAPKLWFKDKRQYDLIPQQWIKI